MSSKEDPDDQESHALELFQPQPGVFYGLDETTELAGVSRRTLLIYCRAGLVQPVYQPPHGAMGFPDEAILAMRRLERLRVEHGLDVPALQLMASLLEELEHLRAELRFWRG